MASGNGGASGHCHERSQIAGFQMRGGTTAAGNGRCIELRHEDVCDGSSRTSSGIIIVIGVVGVAALRIDDGRVGG